MSTFPPRPTPPALSWNPAGNVDVVNGTTINQSVGPSDITIYCRIATLATGTLQTQDLISVELLMGRVASPELTTITYTAQNRNIRNQYTRFGPAETLLGIQRYQEADGSASIYVVSLAAGAFFWSLNWSVRFSNKDVTLYIPPLFTAPNGNPTPTGVLNWSTLNETTYPPLFAVPAP